MVKRNKGAIAILVLFALALSVSIVSADTTPPESITNLKNISYVTSYINWTWKDPTSSDFAKVMVYIDGVFKKNVTKGTRYYKATGLLPNTSHKISTHTVDTSGNINKTWVNHTAWTKRDFAAPNSITGLKNISYAPTNINWAWTDSISTDFAKVIVYIDGVSKGYVDKGVRYYSATGFLPYTSHNISTHTVDTSGNINNTWVNDTERTAELLSPSTTPTTTSNLGIFYYPWTGGNSTVSPTGMWRHWLDGGHHPPNTWASNYLPDVILTGIWDPSSRLYSSKDIGTIDRQFGLIKKSGIGFIISSWWGQNSYEDQALSIVVNNVVSNYVENVNFTIYYEKEGFNPIPESDIVNDINYIKNKYANSPSFLKINGKPVVFVYNIGGGGETDLQKAQKWKRVRDATGIYTVLKVFGGYQNNASLADSWHQYAPAHAGGFEQQGSYSAFITPGFDRYDPSSGTPYLERENFTRWENNAIQLKNANVQFKLIETWNEWGEGTGIEPAQKINHNDGGVFTPAADSYGTEYIDILSKYFST